MIYIIIALIIIIAVLYTAVSICFHKYKTAVSSLEAEHTQLLQLQEEYYFLLPILLTINLGGLKYESRWFLKL